MYTCNYVSLLKTQLGKVFKSRRKKNKTINRTTLDQVHT